jgi:hypothetical protein
MSLLLSGFEISDTWVDTSTITTSNGAPTCTTYKGVSDGLTIGPITAVCSGGMTNVVFVVYSEDIMYESTIIPEACSSSPTEDTCTYEFVILCGGEGSCTESPTNSPTERTTGAPTAGPTPSPSDEPSSFPSSRPSVTPSVSPLGNGRGVFVSLRCVCLHSCGKPFTSPIPGVTMSKVRLKDIFIISSDPVMARLMKEIKNWSNVGQTLVKHIFHRVVGIKDFHAIY